MFLVFSAPKYCDATENKGAYINIGPDLKLDFHKFDAVPHPNIRPMVRRSPPFLFSFLFAFSFLFFLSSLPFSFPFPFVFSLVSLEMTSSQLKIQTSN